MPDWPTRSFADLFEEPLRNGLTRPTAVRGTGVKMVNMGEIFAHRRIGNIAMDRVPVSDPEADRYLLHPGDLLFARQSLVLSGAGKCSLFVGATEPVTFEGHLIRARLDPEVAESAFYFYLFSSRPGRAIIERIVEQVAAAGIRASDLARLDVPYPPLPEQRAIASILGALDDKIDLNRRMNETQDALIDARYSMLLERGSRDDVRLGSIYEFAAVKYGAPFSSLLFNSKGVGLPLIRIRDLATHAPEVFTPEVHPRATHIRPGDVVVGMDGEFRVHHWQGEEALLNQRVCLFAPQPGVPRTYLSRVLRGPLMEFERGKTGTTVIHLGKSDIDTFQVPIPSSTELRSFGEITEPLLEMLLLKARQSRTLAALRDTLLPKLISGELRIKDAERLAEAAL